jgi:hypothetical protein
MYTADDSINCEIYQHGVKQHDYSFHRNHHLIHNTEQFMVPKTVDEGMLHALQLRMGRQDPLQE